MSNYCTKSMFMAGATMKQEEWILNSCSTNHMSRNAEQFKTFIKLTKLEPIEFKNEECLDAVGIG